MDKEKRPTLDEAIQEMQEARKELEEAGLPEDQINEVMKIGLFEQIARQLERIADLMEQQARWRGL